MPNEYGRDYRIAIGDGAQAEAFKTIGGETTLNWKRASQDQDISDKDGGIYGSTSYGQQKLTFAVSGNIKLPDAGFSAIYAASKANPPEVDIEITKGGIVKFKGRCGVGNFSADFPLNGPATYSYDLANVGAPMIDALDAQA